MRTLVLMVALLQSPAAVAPVIQFGDMTVTLDATTWAKLPRETMTADDHGTKATFEGVKLRRVLALVNARWI